MTTYSTGVYVFVTLHPSFVPSERGQTEVVLAGPNEAQTRSGQRGAPPGTHDLSNLGQKGVRTQPEPPLGFLLIQHQHEKCQ